MPEEAISRFYTLWGEIEDLESTIELLHWDQETVMPEAGNERRGELLATLTGVQHRQLTDPALADTIAAALEACNDDGDDPRELATARHLVDRATRVPVELAQELASASSAGLSRWRKARAQESFAPFAAALERNVTLRREEATALAAGEHIYDGLLDGYDPGTRTAELVPLFDSLGSALADAVARAADTGATIDETKAYGDFDPDAQLAFGRWSAEEIGFDFSRGRIDPTVHPFCAGSGPTDVRITWRYDRDDFRPALFGILHEAGHGMYEQGLPIDRARKPTGRARSMGVHESQSRLWENHVGRHPGFWRHAFPRFQDHFSSWSGTLDELCPTMHKVQPSLIRVEADEVTYNLHILVRFRLELDLIEGDLAVADLPTAWDEAYEGMLGVRADKPSMGVLQDVHWASGLFGYFPTYTLGSLLSAQLFEAAEAELGDLEEAFAAGQFAPLLKWLHDKIHRHGCYHSATQLTEAATGRPLSADAFLRYVDAKLERFYGLGSSNGNG